MKRSTIIILALVSLLLIGVLAGCSKKEEAPANTTTTTKAPETTTKAPETTTAKPADDTTKEAESKDEGLTEEKISAEYKFALMLQNTWNPFFTEIR
ncbi:MAG: hypothetical protein IJR36_00485, partial [Lachnospiraceae bacterium]|nr:hypothetical protein [Lachnospiraceae bacterium]